MVLLQSVVLFRLPRTIVIIRARKLGTKPKSLEHDTISSHSGGDKQESKLNSIKTSNHRIRGIDHEQSIHCHAHKIVRNDRIREQYRAVNVQRYASSSSTHHNVQQAIIHEPRESIDGVRQDRPGDRCATVRLKRTTHISKALETVTRHLSLSIYASILLIDVH